MTEDFLDNYFKNLAINLVDIAHTVDAPAYYRMKDSMDLDEFDNAVRNMTKSTCLLLEIGSGNMGDYDNVNDALTIGLHCLVKTTDKYADINAARDQAKSILLKIITRIRFDCRDKYIRNTVANGPLKALNVIFDSKIKYENMTDIDGNWYGKSFYFYFRAPVQELPYNSNDWTA